MCCGHPLNGASPSHPRLGEAPWPLGSWTNSPVTAAGALVNKPEVRTPPVPTTGAARSYPGATADRRAARRLLGQPSVGPTTVSSSARTSPLARLPRPVRAGRASRRRRGPASERLVGGDGDAVLLLLLGQNLKELGAAAVEFEVAEFVHFEEADASVAGDGLAELLVVCGLDKLVHQAGRGGRRPAPRRRPHLTRAPGGGRRSGEGAAGDCPSQAHRAQPVATHRVGARDVTLAGDGSGVPGSVDDTDRVGAGR
jgi:hypothetical protein